MPRPAPLPLGLLAALASAAWGSGCARQARPPAHLVERADDPAPAEVPAEPVPTEGRRQRAARIAHAFLEALDRESVEALEALLAPRPLSTASLERAPTPRTEASAAELLDLLRERPRGRRRAPARAGLLPFSVPEAMARARVMRLDAPTLRWRVPRPEDLQASDLLVVVPLPSAAGPVVLLLGGRRGRWRILVRPEAERPVLGF